MSETSDKREPLIPAFVLPYFLPYIAFGLASEDFLPAEWVLPLKVALPLGLLLYFGLRGRYPELRGFRLDGGVALDVAVGLALTAVWVAPFLWFEGMRPEAAGFDANLWGEEWSTERLGLRLLGFALVTPFMEELFIRSFVMRLADVFAGKEEFEEIPIARFTWASFGLTTILFTFTHVSWEWPVAAVWIIATNLWFYHRKSMGSVIVVHAVTNLALFAFVVLGDQYWFFI